MTEASVMNYLLHEALPLTVPYGAQTLSTIAYHPVKVVFLYVLYFPAI
jgi:hypothetical protein